MVRYSSIMPNTSSTSLSPQLNNFVFFGTPPTARDSLALLAERGFRPKLVVTNPDAPKGRGMALSESPVKAWALENSIPVETPNKLDADAIALIKNAHADYAVVIAYGKIFPQALIDAFPLGVLNVHYSLLPAFRGATPVESALRSSDYVLTGVTVQRMALRMDAGDILGQSLLHVQEFETARGVRPKLIALGADLLEKILPRFVAGAAEYTPQDESFATYTKKLTKEDGLLAPHLSGEEKWLAYRAYNDSIGTYFVEDGKRVKITDAVFANSYFTPRTVIPEGKKEMSYEEYEKGRAKRG
jgi:methionyl-tRNA formyltransferase